MVLTRSKQTAQGRIQSQMSSLPDLKPKGETHLDLVIPEDADGYNFRHFRRAHAWADARRTWNEVGLLPSQVAPDFELQSTDGQSVRLSSLRGKPVVLHFGSYT